MSNADRRSFLTGSMAFVAGFGSPTHAGQDPITCNVIEHRTCWQRDEQMIVEMIHHDSPSMLREALATPFAALAHGLSALKVAKYLQVVPAGIQVHWEMQRLIQDLALAVGTALKEADRLLDEWLLDISQDEGLVRDILKSLFVEFEFLDLSAQHKAMVKGPLEAIVEDERPGSLREHLMTAQRQIHRLFRVAERIVSRRSPAQLLKVSDASLTAEVVGSPYRAEPTQSQCDDKSVTRVGELLIVLGYMALGVGVVIGYIVIVVGFCVAVCGTPQGLILMIVGLAILSVSIVILAKFPTITSREISASGGFSCP